MEKSHLVRFLGDYPFARVIDFLIENKLFDYTKTEIAKGAGISRVSLYKMWDELEEFGVVRPTRRIGKAVLHKLNEKNPIVQNLLELDFKLSKEYVERLAERQKAVAKAR